MPLASAANEFAKHKRSESGVNECCIAAAAIAAREDTGGVIREVQAASKRTAVVRESVGVVKTSVSRLSGLGRTPQINARLLTMDVLDSMVDVPG
jgi:hypothetical protein